MANAVKYSLNEIPVQNRPTVARLTPPCPSGLQHPALVIEDAILSGYEFKKMLKKCVAIVIPRRKTPGCWGRFTFASAL